MQLAEHSILTVELDVLIEISVIKSGPVQVMVRDLIADGVRGAARCLVSVS